MNITPIKSKQVRISTSNLTEQDLHILKNPPDALSVYKSNNDPSFNRGFFLYLIEDKPDFKDMLKHFSNPIKEVLQYCFDNNITWLRIY